MSSYKALVRVAGLATLLGASDTLHVGAGIDAPSAATLQIGVSNASALTISKSGATSTVSGALTVSETMTANGSSTGLVVTNAATVGGTLTITGSLIPGGGIDRATATTMSIGATNATAITVGRTGQTVTFPGNVTVSGTLSASISPVTTGLTTTGVTVGLLGYVSGANTMTKAQSDSTAAKAQFFGINNGNAGEMIYAGTATLAMTTAGGSPSNGAQVYVAALTDDTNAGAGKATATEPTSGYAAVVGIVLDNSNYAGSKTVVVLLKHEPIVFIA